MKNFRLAFPVFILAAAAGAAFGAQPSSPAAAPANPYDLGKTADGKTIVSPDAMGPFTEGTCVAGSAACAAAPAGAADLSSVEGPLQDVGRLQRTEAVKKDEDAMLQSGVYKSIDRDPSGSGAVITLPNGKVTWSDYAKGFNTMPKDPQQVLNDPNAPAAEKAAISKMLAKTSAQAGSDKIECANYSASPACARVQQSPGAADGAAKTGAPDPKPETAGASPAAPAPDGETPPAADGAPDPQAPDEADLRGLAERFLSAPGGTRETGGAREGNPDSSARAASRRKMEELSGQAVLTAGTAEGYTFTRLIREIREGSAFEELVKAKDSAAKAKAPDPKDDAAAPAPFRVTTNPL